MDTEAGLVHCIYASATTLAFSDDDLVALLEVVRKKNAELNVTGMLLYDSGSFFQVIEGESSVIEPLFNKISGDKRHSRIAKLIYEPIASRSFSEWTMGYVGVGRAQLKAINGLNDFFLSGKCYIELDEGRAKILLDAFKEGKWRAAIT